MTPDIDNWHDLECHELCDVFPAMSEAEYESLVSSIANNGFFATDPIVLIQGEDSVYRVLDGRHRLQACMDAGKTPKFTVLDDSVDPLRWVVARNVERRQLSAGQKAALASDLADLKPGQVPSANIGWGVTREEAAKIMSIPVARIAEFRTIANRDEEEANRVRAGVVSISQAYARVKVPASETPTEETIDGQDDVHDVAQRTAGTADENAEVRPPSPEKVQASLVVDNTEPAGSLNMAFEGQRAFDWSAHYDRNSGKVAITIGDQSFEIRPDTAASLGEAILDAVADSRGDE